MPAQLKSYKGFSLIELMTTISSIAALTALVFPAYQNHIIRTRVSEGLTLANAAKAVIMEALSSQERSAIAPYSGSGAALTNSYSYTFYPSKHVTSNAISGVVNTTSISTNEDLHSALGAPHLLTPGSGALIAATPTTSPKAGEPIIWSYSINSTAAFKYTPANCRFLP